jgi:hypothetical protein
MALLGCTLGTLSDEVWRRAFGAYVAANKSHWTGPPIEHVRQVLGAKGAYEFCVPVMGTWYSKFRIAVLADGQLDAQFVKNPAAEGRMHEKLEKMEREFERAISAT